MEETILTWNATNWITVVLMVAISFMVLGAGAQLFHNWRGTGDQSAAS